MDKISGILSSRRTAVPVSDQNNIRPGAYNPFAKKEDASLAIAQDSYDKFFSPNYKSSFDAAQAMNGVNQGASSQNASISDEMGFDSSEVSAGPSINVADLDRTNSAPMANARPAGDLDLNSSDTEGFSYRDYPKGSFLNVAA